MRGEGKICDRANDITGELGLGARGMASKLGTIEGGGACDSDGFGEMEPRSRAARDEAGEGGGSVNVVGKTSGSEVFISAAKVAAGCIMGGESSGVVDLWSPFSVSSVGPFCRISGS